MFIALIVLIAAFAVYYFTDHSLLKQNLPDSAFETEQSRKELPVEGSLFRIFAKDSDLQVDYEAKTVLYSNAEFELKPELKDLYYKVGLLNETQNTVVVYPVFTEAAYAKNGFYDYYNDRCDVSCLTAKVYTDFDGQYSASRSAFHVLRLLGYQYITDIDIDKNPDVLKNYDKIILLHSEYVTKNEFDAITQHPKVLYLYPNALFAEVAADHEAGTITLVRGHGYPSSEIRNGFDWKFDNTDYEYNNQCMNWRFYEIDNGIMLDCYPEYVIFKDAILLKKIKDY
jgi:hypothetical protein